MGGKTRDAYAAKPRIEIDGATLAPDVELSLERVMVDDHIGLPAMFVIRFRDAGRDIIERAALRMASTVRILAGPQGEEASELLIEGEVTAFEAEFDVSGSHSIVRGYDVSHRLHRGRRTDTYRDVTDSDIARRVAERAGLQPGQIDPTTTVHHHVSQANVSDWEFLNQRARETGYEVGVLDGKLAFHAVPDASQAPQPGDLTTIDPLQLVFGANLISLRPRVTSAELVSEVQVRGWDAQNKQALLGRAPARTTSATLSTDAKSLAGVFGESVYVGVDRPLGTQEEVDNMAVALSDYIAGGFAETEGVATGNPKLRAGSTVSVGLTGPPFEGVYTVTTSRHVFDVGGYRTHFAASGRYQRSLLSLTGGTNGDGAPHRIDGVVVAQVTNVSDEKGQARVKLAFPWLSDSYETDWVRVVQLGAGKERGFVVVPEVNDEVLVSFEQGDFRRPYVIGGLYNGVDKPRFEASDLIDKTKGEVLQRGFVSRKGHALLFLDHDSGHGIDLATDGESLRVKLDASKTAIQIASDGTVTIEGAREVSIKGKTLELKADNGISIDGGAGNVTVKGTQIRLN